MEVTKQPLTRRFFILSNKNNKLVFHKLIAKIGGNFVNNTIKKYNGDYRIFEDIFYHLVNKSKKRFGAVRLMKDIPPVKIVESTVILTALKLAPYFQMDSCRAGIKISTLFNGEFPEKINVVKGAVNDRKCIDGLFEDEDSIYVFDRGYYNYKWYGSA